MCIFTFWIKIKIVCYIHIWIQITDTNIISIATEFDSSHIGVNFLFWWLSEFYTKFQIYTKFKYAGKLINQI